MRNSMAFVLSGLMAVNFTAYSPEKTQASVIQTNIQYVSSSVDEKTEYVSTNGQVKIPKYVFNHYVKLNKASEEEDLIRYGMDDSAIIKFWNTPETWNGEEYVGVKAIDRLKEQTLHSLQGFYILLERAEKTGTKAKKTELVEMNNEVDEEVAAMQKNGDNGEYIYTKEIGVTPKQMKEMNENWLKVDAYRNKIFKENKPTLQEVKDYYYENISDYDEVTVQHILIDLTDNMTDAEIKAKEAKAKEILEKVVANFDMKTLVAEFSDDLESKDSSGEYTFVKDQMMEEFSDWSFNAKTGDTGLIKTDYGYHVMKFIKRELGSLDEKSEEISSILSEQRGSKVLENIIETYKFKWVTNESAYNEITFK